jgi:glucose 1-dehydrogenase
MSPANTLLEHKTKTTNVGISFMSENCQNWLDLDGKMAVVTGAAGGIGKATADLLVALGANVAYLDLDQDACQANAVSTDPSGETAIGLTCDVADVSSVTAARDTVVDKWGGCDILVNNAGILRPGDLKDIDLEDWSKTLRVNLDGYLICAQHFGALMEARGGGALVHVASIAGLHPQPHSGAYSPSKAAVAMMSQQFAFEWGPAGIRSNVVSPGLIRTPLSESFYQSPGLVERREAVIPTRRIGMPIDIANAVAFLASPRASYVNGQEIVVDGGFTRTLMSHVPRPGFD